MMAAETLHPGLPLSALLADLASVAAAQDVTVTGLALDSRRVRPGDLFFALAGVHEHGLRHVAEACRRGAVAVCWEPDEEIDETAPELQGLNLPVVAVPALGTQVSVIAGRFHHHPSRQFYTVGVTGTDGKTSCSHFIAQTLHGPGRACGLIGTLGAGLYDALDPVTHTTPDPVSLQAILAGMRDQGARAVVMEVSSHALDQARAGGVHFDVAVLTHVSRDHLDYHGSDGAYRDAKRRLFRFPSLRLAVLNADDDLGRELLAADALDCPVCAYALEATELARRSERFVVAERVETARTGLQLQILTHRGAVELHSGLLGRFNAANLLAALAVLLDHGLSPEEAAQRLAGVTTVPGRMEALGGSGGRPLVVIDYAHTPRALEQVLLALREHCAGHLWCIFGAGGERDPGKRPLMGAAVERLADFVMLTTDNPRHEDPTQIVVDILGGTTDPDACYIQPDRARAIAHVLELARPNDVVLIAGKGHEDYQLIGERRLHFSDREVVQTWFETGGQS
ncbi:MAG TPA: UDP-N-acetylmuramoyl-L-alanyl-D-glutamate--2,6-diaminopimelate ligase [Thiohalobacter sp.]|nr:UDP-N-acetylmuramoyl-L-alanyl-D-glutamate--2,6-diaminopimelate ligase [Thiohalobacter sp.]